MRLRPSYFPFTEPSAESRYQLRTVPWRGLPGVQAHRLARDRGLRHGAPTGVQGRGIDAERYTGFAFGAGIERLAMLRFG